MMTNTPDMNVLMAQFVHIDASDAKHGSTRAPSPDIKPKYIKPDQPDLDLSQLSEDILTLRANLLKLASDASIPAKTVLELRSNIIELNTLQDKVLNYLANNLSNLSDECDNLALRNSELENGR